MGPLGSETPCAWFLRVQETLSLEEQLELAESKSELFTGSDIRCLRKAAVHKRVIQAANTARTSAGDVLASVAQGLDQAAADAAERKADQERRTAGVRINGAVIAPTKSTGQAWDGFGTDVASADVDAVVGLVAALGSLPVPAASAAPVAAKLTEITNRGVAAPDVFGTVELLRDGNRQGQASIPKQQDAFTPSWNVGWNNVFLDDQTRVRIQLFDADLSAHDPIGVIELDGEALLTAHDLGENVAVPVTTQTSNQVLMLYVSVY